MRGGMTASYWKGKPMAGCQDRLTGPQQKGPINWLTLILCEANVSPVLVYFQCAASLSASYRAPLTQIGVRIPASQPILKTKKPGSHWSFHAAALFALALCEPKTGSLVSLDLIWIRPKSSHFRILRAESSPQPGVYSSLLRDRD